MSGFCTQCGSLLPPHAVFCDACGHAVLTSEQAGKSASRDSGGSAHAQEKTSKRSLLAAAAILGLLGVVALSGLLWPMGDNNGYATALRTKEDKVLTAIMGGWGSAPDSAVALFEFRPETMTTSGHTFPVRYARVGDSISVEGGDPPRELAKLFVVTPKEIRLEGAATVTLYRVR